MKIKIIIILIIVVTLSLMVFGVNHSNSTDKSNLQYLRALQELCKQNENSVGTIAMIDGERWQNATHYFDVPDCQFRKLISSDYTGILENEK